MSVRRLAEDQVQPASFVFSKENATWAKATIKKYPKGREQSAVIPLLMRAQEQEGWVTKASIEAIADMLGMAYIRVLEVATFYTQFQLKPVGTRAHVQVCGTTPCMLRGSEDLIAVCKKKIHAEPLHLNEEGTLSWEEVECQGACVNAPMVMIFKDSYEDLTPIQLDHIIDRFQAGRPADIKPGPQIDRIYSAPFGGLTSLTTEAKPVKAKAEKPAAAKAAAKPVAAKAADKPAAAKTSAKPAAEKVAAPAPVAEKPAAAPKAVEKPAAKIAAKPAAKAAKPGKPALDDPNRPAQVEKPAALDDLKLVSGIGPKIEAILHGLGIYTFAQIVSWKKAERAWVDDYLSFSGRIERDEWQKQAKALAKGGEAEYIKVFGKKPR